MNVVNLFFVSNQKNSMRIISLPLEVIQFERKQYESSLEESVLRRGLAFPIKVRFENDQYYCEDGHKRLTILEILSKKDPNHRYLKKIPVILINTDLNRSNDCWRGRNVH